MNKLKIHQVVNHFMNNVEITKKSGLQKNLKNLIFKKIDVDKFYPRSYELSERNDFEDFLEDFKFTKSISILKLFLLGKRQISEEMLISALEICKRKLFYFEENKKSILESIKDIKLITNKEWHYISEEDMLYYSKEVEKLEKMNKIGYTSKRSNSGGNLIELESCKPEKSLKKLSILEKNNNKTNEKDLQLYVSEVSLLLEKLDLFLPQMNINGLKNIWILKPSGLSRGRGITCLNSLNEIFGLIKKNSNQYIAQKYIENPLIIYGRKFDIRQWVLVTSLSPLTIWIYETPYLRFGAEDYKLEDFSNLFSHLTNNSIVKYSKNFNDNKIEGNMWEIGQFSEFLIQNYGKDLWKSDIQEKIKNIVTYSLESAKHKMTNRKNSFELFGYDFMVDDKFNVWLIEVNSSPAMDYSTVSIFQHRLSLKG